MTSRVAILVALFSILPLSAQEGTVPRASGGGVFRVGGGVSAPKVVFSPEPQCTDRAIAAKQQGTEILWLVVGADGVPRDIHVHTSLGADLDQRAIETVQSWRFDPSEKDGKPVAVQINIQIKFNCGSPQIASSQSFPGRDQTGPKTIDGEQVYRVGNGVSAPRAIYSPSPQYDEEARKSKDQGAVVLWLIVTKEGKPRDVRVSKSLRPELDVKALDAVRSWSFDPATKNGQPVNVEINVSVDFKLY